MNTGCFCKQGDGVKVDCLFLVVLNVAGFVSPLESFFDLVEGLLLLCFDKKLKKKNSVISQVFTPQLNCFVFFYSNLFSFPHRMSFQEKLAYD